MLTVDDLATMAGLIFPRLETLGLDVPWHLTPSSAEWDFLVASSVLRTLHVGADRSLLDQGSSKVAKFLKEHFPGLQYLYRHRKMFIYDEWDGVVVANGYSGGYYGRVNGDGLRDWCW